LLRERKGKGIPERRRKLVKLWGNLARKYQTLVQGGGLEGGGGEKGYSCQEVRATHGPIKRKLGGKKRKGGKKAGWGRKDRRSGIRGDGGVFSSRLITVKRGQKSLRLRK